jgi:hypothetical protein
MKRRTWFPVSSGLLTWEHYQRISAAWMVFLWMIHEQRAPKNGEGDTGVVRDGEPISSEQIGASLGGMPIRTVERHLATLEHEKYIRAERLAHGKRYYVANPLRWLMTSAKNGGSPATHPPEVADHSTESSATNGGTHPPEVADHSGIRIKVIEPRTNPLPPNGGGNELSLVGEVENPATRGQKQKKEPDPRHQPFREKLERFWTYMNPDSSSANWNAADAGQLGKLLRERPALTIKEFHQWLVNYSESDGINPPDRPHEFLPKIHRYADGSKDRYGKPREEVHA